MVWCDPRDVRVPVDLTYVVEVALFFVLDEVIAKVRHLSCGLSSRARRKKGRYCEGDRKDAPPQPDFHCARPSTCGRRVIAVMTECASHVSPPLSRWVEPYRRLMSRRLADTVVRGLYVSARSEMRRIAKWAKRMSDPVYQRLSTQLELIGARPF